MPFAGGSASDVVSRVLFNKMAAILGRPIVVENKPGAGGNLGTALAARAAPDGYTLVIGSVSTISINPSLYVNAGYDPRKDFAPIGLMASMPVVLLAHPSFPGKTVADVIAIAKKQPGKLDIGTSAIGTGGYMSAESFKSMAGIDVAIIPYKGTAPANADLLSGSVQLFMDPWTALLPLATSGKARGLFVTSRQRTQLASDIPTTAEVGFKDFNVSTWQGLWAPRATPDAIVDRLASAMAEVSKDPDFIAKTALIGIVPTARGPTEFAAFIKSEVETNTELLKEAGYKPD